MALAPSVDRAFSAIDASSGSLSKDIHETLALIKIAAEDLERASKGCDEVKALDSSVLELITACNDLERHKSAMRALKENYQFKPNECTDFKTLCQADMDKLPVPAANEAQIYKQFQEAIWNVHNAGIPMPGEEQAEITCSAQTGILNKTCPISGKPVTELENPVRCTECHHIYDLQAALDYIGRSRNKTCAAAGCPKKISAANLVCDQALRVEIEVLKMQGEGTSHARVEHLTDLDVTELDDED